MAVADGVHLFVFVFAPFNVAQLGALSRTVIASEQNHGIIAQAELINLLHQLADHVIHALDHFAVIHPAILAGHIGHLHRNVVGHIMRQGHGIKGEERCVRLRTLGHEVAKEINV